MTEKEKLLIEKEEAMSRLACLDYEDNGESLPDSPEWDEFEKVLADAAIPPEMAWDGKAKRALRDYRLEKTRGAVRHHWRVTIIAAALLVGMACVAYARHQEAIHNFIMTITDRYFTIGGESIDDNRYFDLTKMYVPQYIPPGFHLAHNSKASDHIALEYENRNETESICFQQAIDSAGFILDTDKAVEMRQITVKNSPGLYAANADGTTMLYWGDHWQFLIRGTASSTELLKMAESVMFVP